MEKLIRHTLFALLILVAMSLAFIALAAFRRSAGLPPSILVYLLISVQRKSQRRPAHRTRSLCPGGAGWQAGGPGSARFAAGRRGRRGGCVGHLAFVAGRTTTAHAEQAGENRSAAAGRRVSDRRRGQSHFRCAKIGTVP